MAVNTRKADKGSSSVLGDSSAGLSLQTVLARMAVDTELAAIRGLKGSYTVDLHYQNGVLQYARRKMTGSRCKVLQNLVEQNLPRVKEAGAYLMEADMLATQKGFWGMLSVTLEYEGGVVVRINETSDLTDGKK